MTLFLRFLRAWADFDVWFANYRMAYLSELLTTGQVDLDFYITKRNDLAFEKEHAMNDFRKWDAAIHSISLNRSET